jgi:hypothetical protein
MGNTSTPVESCTLRLACVHFTDLFLDEVDVIVTVTSGPF